MRNALHFSLISRLVLGWFVLALGVSIASPIAKPQDILLVCSASGTMRMLVADDDGGATELTPHLTDCPLCVPAVSLPPTIDAWAFEPIQPLSYALQSIPSAHIAARTAAPLPARGPPSVI